MRAKANRTALFGTDGIRAAYGKFPLTEKDLIKMGAAISEIYTRGSVIIGRDSRQSGEAIMNFLFEGLNARMELIDAGVVPTPTLSMLVPQIGADLGIMITASHNPYTDNGLKLFDRKGIKIASDIESQIENRFHQAGDPYPATERPVTPQRHVHGDEYGAHIERVLKRFGADLAGIRDLFNESVVDCANGAFSRAAPECFKYLGIKGASFIHHAPDGSNINVNCGSTAPETLSEFVRTHQKRFGIAFDGDGDRLICVDGKGRVLDGDHIMLSISELFSKQSLPGFDRVVGTVMANLGLELALKDRDIRFLRADVGDKHVIKMMGETGAALGGEQSGHIVFKGMHTGDGLLTALMFGHALSTLKLDVNDIFERIRTFPQSLVSIPVTEKIPLSEWTELRELEAQFNRDHGADSRIVVRYSGTEPKLRVMIESESADTVDRYIRYFEDIINKKIGVKR